MLQCGLVLEGGGMKGVYTAGVLDFFLDQKLEFSSVYGVSAGACCMCSFIAKQRGRARDVMMDYLYSRKYCSVRIDGELYLDGGISDAIPLQKSVTDGNRKNVVVMTKEVGFVRKPASQLALIRARYIRYPKVAELMAHRHTNYNEQTAYIETLQQEGKAFVIRPKKKPQVGRVEKDAEKLRAFYEEGYRDAEEAYEALRKYLSSEY